MSMYDKVSEFIDKMEMGYSPEVTSLYLDLIDEEYEEWLQEIYMIDKKYSEERELKEVCDVLYVLLGYLVQITKGTDRKFELVKHPGSATLTLENLLEEGYSKPNRVVDYSKVVAAIAAVTAYARSRSWDIVEAFDRVHKSNMSKLGDDGKPVRNEHGKIVKGPNYKKPDLKDLVA